MSMTFTPYLNFDGDCEEAMRFYSETFNGKIIVQQRFADAPMPVPESHKQKILHIELKGEGVHLMGSDVTPQYTLPQDSRISLSVSLDDTKEQDRIWKQLSHGGKITMELQDTFWGARFGMVTDRFGTKWLLNVDKKK